MKKMFLTMVGALAVCLLVFAFAACGPSPETGGSEYKVTFDYNYDGAPAASVVTVREDDGVYLVEMPADPSRTNYAFTGWYTDAACTDEIDPEENINSDRTYYAGWKRTAYVVTFDYNYDGRDDDTVTVAVGSTVTAPANVSRPGYIFDAWYTSASDYNPDEDYYDFSVAPVSDMTLYAGWIEVPEDDDSSEEDSAICTVSFMWNYDGAENDGVYSAVDRTNGSTYNIRRNPFPTLERNGYYFSGWYFDAECTEQVTENFTVTADMYLYAGWLKVNVFEAEYTDLDGKVGWGYSGNAYDEGIANKDSWGMNASNDWLVGWLYHEGTTLEFQIYCEEAVTDAVLAFRLSAEYQELIMTPENVAIRVNGTDISYEPITFTDVPSESAGYKRAFTDHIIGDINLDQGNNTITIAITNDDKGVGGTMYASAPIVDCMYLYTDALVEWAEGFPKTENIQQSAAE